MVWNTDRKEYRMSSKIPPVLKGGGGQRVYMRKWRVGEVRD